MIIEMRSYVRFFLLAGVLTLVPAHVSGDSVGYEAALANNAGGNGKGKGQGASNAGNTGGGSTASAGATAGKDDPLHPSNNGRINAVLNASSNAWQHASLNSTIGLVAIEYANALGAYLTATAATTTDANAVVPTLDDAAAILAQLANKDPITEAQVEAIHQRLLDEGLISETLLQSAPATTADATFASSDPTVQAQPTLAEQIAELANSMQASQTNEGLGPIY